MDAAPRGVFLSYRRSDGAPFAGRVYEALKRALPEWEVFLDVTSIASGVDFWPVITDWLTKSSVVLVVITPSWNDAESMRSDSSVDYLRLEVEHAIGLQIPLIPVLMDNTRMPGGHQLSGTLRSLADLNAETLRHETFERDLAAVISRMRNLAGDQPAPGVVAVAVVRADRRERVLRLQVGDEPYVIRYRNPKGGFFKGEAYHLSINGNDAKFQLSEIHTPTFARYVQEHRLEFTVPVKSGPMPSEIRVRSGSSERARIIGFRMTVGGDVVYEDGWS